MPSHSEGPGIWLSVWRFLSDSLLVWVSSGGSRQNLRCSHRRSVPNLLDATHMWLALDILSYVEVRRRDLETWSESDVMSRNRISAQWIITFKALHRRYTKTIFLLYFSSVIFFKTLIILLWLFRKRWHILVFDHYATLRKFYPFNANYTDFWEDVNFVVFVVFILPIETHISNFHLHKAKNIKAYHIFVFQTDFSLYLRLKCCI